METNKNNPENFKLVIKQKVTYTDLDDYDYDDVVINNEEELEEKFQEELDRILDELNSSEKSKIDFFSDAAQYINSIDSVELSNNVITVVVNLNKKLNREQRTQYFKDTISDFISDLEPQRIEFTVDAGVMNAADRFDSSTGEEWEEEQDEFEDSDYVNLIIDPNPNNRIPFIDSNSISESKEDDVRNVTDQIFDDFSYTESIWEKDLPRGVAKYLYDTYSGGDIKKFDEYLKVSGFRREDISSLTREWVDKLMEEARSYIKEESFLKEDMKSGISKILDKFKDKIDYKYQGNKKNQDGNKYDRFVCKIKKAGIFDLISFEEKLKELGNKFNIIFKVTYPNSKQDHSYFWVEGRYKNKILDKDGSTIAYESKLNESEYTAKRKKEQVDFAYKCHEESKKNGYHKIITLDVQDSYGDIEAMIRYIAGLADPGHSFSIDVDPHDNENKQTFGIDGDGSDRIKITKVECLDEDDKDEESEE